MAPRCARADSFRETHELFNHWVPRNARTVRQLGPAKRKKRSTNGLRETHDPFNRWVPRNRTHRSATGSCNQSLSVACETQDRTERVNVQQNAAPRFCTLYCSTVMETLPCQTHGPPSHWVRRNARANHGRPPANCRKTTLLRDKSGYTKPSAYQNENTKSSR